MYFIVKPTNLTISGGDRFNITSQVNLTCSAIGVPLPAIIWQLDDDNVTIDPSCVFYLYGNYSLVGSDNSMVGSGDSMVGSGDSMVGSGDPMAGSGDSVVGSGDSIEGSGDPMVGSGDCTIIQTLDLANGNTVTDPQDIVELGMSNLTELVVVSNLFIRSLQRSDNGSYTCTVTNTLPVTDTISAVSGPTPVTVLGKIT